MSDDTRFELRWALPQDEPGIRTLVGSVAMPGGVGVRFAREPNYYLGNTIVGDTCDVLVALSRTNCSVVGIACRAERRAFLNGHESTLGYIGQIRIAPEFRGRWLVYRGAKKLREASPPGLLYVGVIARDNNRARAVLVGTRTPGGVYATRVGGLTTCAIVLRPRRVSREQGIEAQPGSADVLPEIVEFLRLEGPRRQFFPAYSLEDFLGGERLRGLRPQDVMVARRGRAIVGLMAAWDQSAYKQDIVDAYGPTLRLLRPLYDIGVRLFGAQPLTQPGEAIKLAFASCICVAGDDPAVMQALLSECAVYAWQRGKAFLMLGLADNDPLLKVAKRWMHITYHSDLFALCWAQDPASLIDGRVPYVEIATL